MKIFLAIFKWTFWIFGFSLITSGFVVAIFDDKTDRWISAITLLVFGLILFFIGYILHINKYQGKRTLIEQSIKGYPVKTSSFDQPTDTVVVQAQLQWKNEVKNYRYHKEQVKGKIHQSLESMEIIESTKNLDTLESRYSFLQKLFRELQIASTYPKYLNDAQETIDDYKQLYYDKIPRRTQLAGILKPLDFDMVAFGGHSVFNCFMRHYSFQLHQIDLLKTESGKKGRYKKLLETLDETSELLRNEFIGGKDFEDLHIKLKQIKIELEQKTL